MAEAIERLFVQKNDSPNATPGSYDPSDPESYENYIQAMISDSVDYESTVLAGRRDTAQNYYYGKLPGLNSDGNDRTETMIIEDPNATYGEILGHDREQANRSTYVSMDVRDAIMLMMPALIRLFAASENPVFLVPRSQDQVEMAEQATAYTNYVFWNDNKGFLILYGALKDALTVKTGFVKWWTDETKETTRKRFTNISADQVQSVADGRSVGQGGEARQAGPEPDAIAAVYAGWSAGWTESSPPPTAGASPPGPPPSGLRRWGHHRCQPLRLQPPWPAPGSVGGSGPAAVADGVASSPADGVRRGDRPV